MLVALAKLGSPAMVGQFVLGLALASPVMLFANLQLRQLLATDARREFRAGDYLGLRATTTALALTCITLMALAGGYGAATAGVIMALGVAKGVEALSDILYGFQQQCERMDRVAISMMLKGVLSLLVLAACVRISGSVLAGCLGLIVSWAAVLWLYDVPRAAELVGFLRPRWDRNRWGRLVWLGLPLGLVMLLIALNINLPRYFVAHHLGERELGIFAALAYVAVAGSAIVGALGQAISPRLAAYAAAANPVAFRRLLLASLALAAALGIVGLVAARLGGRWILTRLYAPSYAEHAVIFVWLMGAASLEYVAAILGHAATASRRIRSQPFYLAFVSVVTLAACAWFVPRLGLLGAAWSVLAGSAAATLANGLLLLGRKSD